ncbi:MAG: ATP-binding protein [Holophagales bacterium]|nr:ATP-binding protein [Holophagales bacterium]
MLARRRHRETLVDLLAWNPVVALLGARQVGKTTLARSLTDESDQPVTYLDLENPTDLAVLEEPMLNLSEPRGLVVIDEVQRRPDLFPILRVLADRPGTPARFLILGSASPELLRQTSETLAGRIAHHELPPFALDEVGAAAGEKLWLRGGFPRSFLAGTDRISYRWRTEFVRTFLERDIPALGFRVAPEAMERFWSMLAHYHGELWNGHELARSLGISAPTVRNYLDILVSTFLVRRLAPWHENLSKRQVKSPKIYFRDTGLLHNLLHIQSLHQLLRHPKLGASWEGLALDAVVTQLGAESRQCFFWRTHSGAELDLVVVEGGRKWGFEFKRTAAPKLTRSMHVAYEDLGLEELILVHAGERTFTLREGFRALAFSRILDDLEPLPSAFEE